MCLIGADIELELFFEFVRKTEELKGSGIEAAIQNVVGTLLNRSFR